MRLISYGLYLGLTLSNLQLLPRLMVNGLPTAFRLRYRQSLTAKESHLVRQSLPMDYVPVSTCGTRGRWKNVNGTDLDTADSESII